MTVTLEQAEKNAKPSYQPRHAAGGVSHPARGYRGKHTAKKAQR